MARVIDFYHEAEVDDEEVQDVHATPHGVLGTVPHLMLHEGFLENALGLRLLAHDVLVNLDKVRIHSHHSNMPKTTKCNLGEFIIDSKQHLCDKGGLPVPWGHVGYTRYVGFADQVTREALELRLAELGDFLFEFIRKYTDKFAPVDRILSMYGTTYYSESSFTMSIELVTRGQDFELLYINGETWKANYRPVLGTEEEARTLNAHGTALREAFMAAMEASS